MPTDALRPWILSFLLIGMTVLSPPRAAAEKISTTQETGAAARILRMPSISAESIAFVHADDIWVVPRSGGTARRLTTFPGAETDPHFSPDGRWIAFSGEYDGNVDVYLIAADGGEPRRLTWHPGEDRVFGWTVDGTGILFTSGRANAPRPWPGLWEVSTEGGMPHPWPLRRVARGMLSPDGRRMAYQRISPWESEFRNYRGGQAQAIRIIDFDTLEVEKLPWNGSNDLSPVWLGDVIFFLSDRDWAMNVWAWDLKTKTLTQRTHFKEFDCKKLSGGAGTLVFENGGWLYTMDADGGEAVRLPVTLEGDFPWARPHWVDASKYIRHAALSPTGKRALFEARGEIFTVPAKEGDIRNLSRSSGAADRAPSWSPDGQRVAWFSDESGEYQLIIADQFGKRIRTIELKDPTFYYTPRWSPDGKYLAFTDADRQLWVLEVASGRAKVVDNERFAPPERNIYPEWSPDSRWIAYTRRLKNQFNAVFVYSIESERSTAITDGLSDARCPAWDASGKYLYFLASTDYGLNVGWLDMSSYFRPLNEAVYLAVLSSDEVSPLRPRSDDEEDRKEDGDRSAGDESGVGREDSRHAEKPGEEGDEKVPTVKIEFDGLQNRIVAFDLPARSYRELKAGREGVLFFTEQVENASGLTLHRYELEDRKDETVVDGIDGFTLSADGGKLLYWRPHHEYHLVDAAGESETKGEALDLSGMQMKVDPSAEWKQIFREAWRFQRDYFYVENVHGLDLDWAWRSYFPWVDHVRHRADLTYLLDILGGETSIGHSFVRGGDEPEVPKVPVGLLGADYELDHGRYRIVKIYSAENWNPDLHAPLSEPGLQVEPRDYLLAVDGRSLNEGMNLYSLFEHTAGVQTTLLVNDEPTTKGAHEITVVPVADETALRRRDWVENNRRKVDELSGGRLAYVWVPDTGSGGYTYFTRYYFAQQDKKGVILDERFNHGGSIADYMVDIMSRKLLGYFSNPVGDKQPFTAPNAAIWGPKVMIINEMSGSGGDMLPYMFRKLGIGPLVGTRTWGGLVGIWDVPPLVDGGTITAPRGGFYDTEGHWAVENEGVAPDVVVEQLPKELNEGHDPQLEKAVELALERLETEGVELLPQPPDPIRVKRPQ